MLAEIVPTLLVSLRVASLASVIVIILSWYLSTYFMNTSSRWARVLQGLLYLPMMMPPVALGYLLLMLCGRQSFFGKLIFQIFSIHLSFSTSAAVLVACVSTLGIGVRTITLGLARIDDEQLHMAHVLGANRRQVLWHIVLPQCWPFIIGGALLIFIKAMAEFGATMVLAGNSFGETRTLALAIWIAMEQPGHEREGLVLVCISVAISIFAVWVADSLQRKLQKI